MKAKIVWFSGSRKVSAIIRFMGCDFVGVAKCSPEDIFDLNYGINLATQRAEIKAYAYGTKTYDKAADEAFRIAKACRVRATEYYTKEVTRCQILSWQKHHN